MKKIILSLLLATTLSGAFMLPAIASAQTTPPAATPTTPPTAAPATPPAGTASAPTTVTGATSGSTINGCGWYDIVCAINPATWIPKVIDAFLELFLLPVAGWMLALSGYMLDFMINYSLNFATQVTAAGSSIVLGWTIIRDIFNMLFIFILIYVSISTMIGEGGFQAKNVLKNIIIAAVLINFSFFFTEVVIDAGNVIGGWLYQGIETTLSHIPNGGGANTIIGSASPSNVSISAGLSGALGIYDIYNPDAPNSLGSLVGGSLDDSTARLIGAFIRLAVIIFATYIFAYVSVLFLARTISLMFSLVMAPLGFAGGLLPATKKAAGEWREELEKNILIVPVFLLFLYIIIAFVNSPLFGAPNLAANTSAFNPTQYFKYFLLAGLLIYALKKTKEYSGHIGDALGKVANQLAGALSGIALGVATGGTGLALRATVGRAGSMVSDSNWAKNLEGSKSRTVSLLGSGIRNAAKTTSKQTFDASGIATSTLGEMGAKIKTPDFAKAPKDGFVGAQKARAKDLRERAGELYATKEEDKIVAAAVATHTEAANSTVANTQEGKDNVRKQTTSAGLMSNSTAAIGQINTELTAARNRNDITEQNRLEAELRVHEADRNKESEKLNGLKTEYENMVAEEIKKKLEIDRKTDKNLDTALTSADRLGNYANTIQNSLAKRLAATAAAIPLGAIAGGIVSGPGLLVNAPLGGVAAKRAIWEQVSAEQKKLAGQIREDKAKGTLKDEKDSAAFIKKLQNAMGNASGGQGGNNPPAVGGTPHP